MNLFQGGFFVVDILEITKKFPDQDACIKHLEEIRWPNGNVFCPHCESTDVSRKNETQEEDEVGRTGRWNCYGCQASFKVTCETVFHGTKVALQKWFLAIALIMNAKKSLSSHQLARDLKLNQKTAWFIMTRIRSEMASKGNQLLKGIIEADDTYIGGKPRKTNKREDQKPAKRGRGTDKDVIIGVVERGGAVVAQLTEDLKGRTILDFVQNVVNTSESTLISDEFIGYKKLAEVLKHEVIDHSVQFVDGEKHTNTIEGFWSLLKRAWFGQHHHYTTVWTPLYVAEACYKYNNRHTENIFAKFVSQSMKLSKMRSR